MTDLTPQELDALEEAVGKTWPTGWRCESKYNEVWFGNVNDQVRLGEFFHDNNADAICLLRNKADALIRMARRSLDWSTTKTQQTFTTHCALRHGLVEDGITTTAF